jgi:hypothetical protein
MPWAAGRNRALADTEALAGARTARAESSAGERVAARER